MKDRKKDLPALALVRQEPPGALTARHLLVYLSALDGRALDSISLVSGSDRSLTLRFPEIPTQPNPIASLLEEQDLCRQEGLPGLSAKTTKEPVDSNRAVRNSAEIVIAKLNALTGSSFRCESAGTLASVRLILRAGYGVDEMMEVLVEKVDEWKGDTEMAKYLRPSTLLRLSNFERYLDELRATKKGASEPGSWQGSGSW